MMSSPATVLLQREFQNLKRRPISADYAIHELVNDNLLEWIVYLFGPTNTCFEGGSFKAIMRFPQDFPNEPPSIQFLSTILHPNVYRDGKLCISTLQIPSPDATAEESQANWTPVLGVHGALESVVSLLADPNPDDPANAEAASLFIHDREGFNSTCKALSKKSVKDLPEGFLKPMPITPVLRREESGGKLFRRTLDQEEDYQYSDDDFCGDEEEDEEEVK